MEHEQAVELLSLHNMKKMYEKKAKVMGHVAVDYIIDTLMRREEKLKDVGNEKL